MSLAYDKAIEKGNMRIQLGDSVWHERRRKVGVLERRQGNWLTVRWPGDGNQREQVQRGDVVPLALAIARKRREQTALTKSLSLTGTSTVADLVQFFGYSTGQLRRDSVTRVLNQLRRAGLTAHPEGEELYNRDAYFHLDIADTNPVEDDEPGELPDTESTAGKETPFALPGPFWPNALGLAAERELAFLRALTGREPILCLLNLPSDTADGSWLQPTWEGVLSWAYRSAQRFVRQGDFEPPYRIQTGPGALLQAYLTPSALEGERPRLRDQPRSLNLICIRSDREMPVDFLRLRALWPGPIFEFTPSSSQLAREDVRALRTLLLGIGGRPDIELVQLSPLRLLVWAREAADQLLTRGSARISAFLASGDATRLRGSNETGTALALKAHVAHWARLVRPAADVQFEVKELEDQENWEGNSIVSRIDIVLDGDERFEIETLYGSGPMEGFCHRKVFSRVKAKGRLSVVVPNDALLWAGPFLADIAHCLGNRGRVLVPADDGGFLVLGGAALAPQDVATEALETAVATDLEPRKERPKSNSTLKLGDVAGYPELHRRLQQTVLWPEKYLMLLPGLSRSPGILLFGPPGCGKSRVARALAGELDQEVRLLAPSDLRGEYIGWGQIRVREQFDWLIERDRRMLVLDELDAVARSRRDRGGMHSDEKATVNELLVQLDRASQHRRIVVGTTNYVGSLDDAVIRSGRFGVFIPVPPPDVPAATKILAYYLRQLADAQAEQALKLVTPSEDSFAPLLTDVFAENERLGIAFCGADLEAAVSQASITAVREAIGDRPQAELQNVLVTLTAEAVVDVLKQGPRSIGSAALKQFKLDVARYCGGMGEAAGRGELADLDPVGPTTTSNGGMQR